MNNNQTEVQPQQCKNGKAFCGINYYCSKCDIEAYKLAERKMSQQDFLYDWFVARHTTD